MTSYGKPQLLFWRSPLLFFLVLGGLVFVLGVGYFFYGLQPQVSASDFQEFHIARGERFADIGARLSREGLVKSISVFKLYALFSGKAQKFQPGIYELAPSMSVPEILEALTTHGQNETAVTVPEGYGLRDADTFLAKAGVLEEGELIRFPIERVRDEYPFLREVESLEGFLFPDTYRFERGSSVTSVVRVFLDTFEAKVWPHLEGRSDWYERLILASFLEREVPEPRDRRLVAGVLLRRLELGMRLQVDATIYYAKCNGAFFECSYRGVRKSDLSVPSPYNTYERSGWTPTPISNPGVGAVRAAAEPEKSPYLYYLSAEGSGETIFSRTLEEHNVNRAKYL